MGGPALSLGQAAEHGSRRSSPTARPALRIAQAVETLGRHHLAALERFDGLWSRGDLDKSRLSDELCPGQVVAVTPGGWHRGQSRACIGVLSVSRTRELERHTQPTQSALAKSDSRTMQDCDVTDDRETEPTPVSVGKAPPHEALKHRLELLLWHSWTGVGHPNQNRTT